MWVSAKINDKTIVIDTTTGLWDYLYPAPGEIEQKIFDLIIHGELVKAPGAQHEIEKAIANAGKS